MAIDNINDLKTWETFCNVIAKKTSKKEIIWKNVEGISRDDTRSPLFVATYGTWNILVYKHAYRYYHDEDRYEWMEDVVVELIDNLGKTLWMLPKVPARHRLLDQIQFTAANIQALLDNVLSDADDDM